VASIKELNGAFDEAKPEIMELVPPMFQKYVTDDKILDIVKAAVDGAEKVRTAAAQAAQAAVVKPAATPAQKS
jgi:hypothetical protein